MNNFFKLNGLLIVGTVLASTNFRTDPTNDIIMITFTQLLPTDHTYAYDFKDIVYRSIIEY